MACDHCEELEEEVRQLKAQLYGRHWHCPLEFGLTRQEERFLAALVAYPGVRGIELLFATVNYGNANDEYEQRLVTVIACKVRRKLKPHGISILTHYARGYSLEPDSRRRLLSWAKQEAA